MTVATDPTCPVPDCFAPETPCSAGHMRNENCPNWTGSSREAPEAIDNTDSERFPWSGRPMGLVDVRFVSGTRRPHLIGIAGPSDAGKTTLLAMLFLAIYRGHKIGEATFAGSYSLQGWENIANYLQLLPADTIKFPPHTSRQGRAPGLLHLALDTNGEQKHVLLTDASGEWFSAWTDRADAETAAGARWIAEHADRLLVTADSDALSGKERGVARNELEFLFNRLKTSYGTSGVALVWTKTDVQIDQNTQTSIEAKFHSCFPEGPVFRVSVPHENGDSDNQTLDQLNTIFSWAFEARVRKLMSYKPGTESSDPFLAYRERS